MFALRFKEGTILGTKKYQIDVSGKLVGFTVESNHDAEFCTSISYKLSGYDDDQVWVTPTRAIAEHAANNNTQWYNAGFNTPENEFVGMLEVVELVVAH